MIQLYGLRMSNYYSLVKAVLIEKGLDFEEVKGVQHRPSKPQSTQQFRYEDGSAPDEWV